MLLITKQPILFKIKTDSAGIIRFKLNEGQLQILAEIKRQIKELGKCRLIIIKGRQLGVTTLMQLVGLSYVMTVPAFNAYTMAHDATLANKIFDDKIKFAYDNLDPEIRSMFTVKRDNVRQLMFEGELMQSNISVGLSARGTTQNFLHISEAGKMSENTRLWDEMISGSLEAAEQAELVVIESTADGGLGQFYEFVQAALRGENEYKVMFLCWTGASKYTRKAPDDDDWIEKYKALAIRHRLCSDPMGIFGISRDQFYWYYKKAVSLKEEIKVQYPFDIEEAFISRSLGKFDVDLVKIAKKEIKPPKRVIDGINIYYDIEPGRVYVLSIDPATGLGADFVGLKARFMDGEKSRDFASFKGKISEQQTARIVVNFANWINQNGGRCLVVPETNMASYLSNYIREHYRDDLIYKRYIQDPNKQYDTLIPDYGFKTTSINRDLIINNFTDQFTQGLIEINDPQEFDEMLKFVWNDTNKRYEAAQGFHDDLLFADFINIEGWNYVRKYL